MPSPLIPTSVAELPSSPDDILLEFLGYLDDQGIEPYPAQEEAILELLGGSSVILNTPTGSGKSLVAAAMHYGSLCQGRRSIYTCPIKALVNEKFLSLCKDFGAEQVGMITGDASVNPGAPIICCTAEILANFALSGGDQAGFDDVIMDEFHFYSDRDRGVAWQIPLLSMTKARFLLMSATMSDPDRFQELISDLTSAPAALVQSNERPVPLEYLWEEDPLETVVENYAENPVYVVHFAQRAAAETAGRLLSINFCTKEEKAAIAAELVGESFRSPFGKEIKKLLRHGIALHHAGILPKYRILAEKLAQKGLLKVICGTDTLGVGINVPIRTVLFTQLFKYDGTGTKILGIRDFHQIAGRAGRKGFDDQGRVVALPPSHVIENIKLEKKAASNPNKKKKIVKKKPPENGFVGWDEKTFRKLIDSPPEKLTSSFRISSGMLLQVLSREQEDGARAMIQLIRDSHETPPQKKQHRRRAFQLFRALREGGIVQPHPRGHLPNGRRVEVNVDLQDDFSLNQTLALYLIEAVPLLDSESETYAFDLLTLVESIVEDPHAILRAQVSKAKDKAMAEMKAEGVEYDERMERLQDITYPKPLKDLIYNTFNDFKADHPWIGDDNIHPKSIAREMAERFLDFPGYIKEYGLQRSEGVLLRHISQVYKALRQTVPDSFKNDAVEELEIYFETALRETDSSLLEEWQSIANLEHETAEKAAPESPKPLLAADDITADPKAFAIRIRNEVFRLLRNLATDQFDAASDQLAPLDESEPHLWPPHQLEALLAPFYELYDYIDFSPEARRAEYLKTNQNENIWKLDQTILADGEPTEFQLQCTLDFAKTKTSNQIQLLLTEITQIS